MQIQIPIFFPLHFTGVDSVWWMKLYVDLDPYIYIYISAKQIY